MVKRSHVSVCLILTLVAAMVAGCAVAPSKTVLIAYTDKFGNDNWADAGLKQRFNEYWFNRFAGDVEANFKMECPHFVELTDFQRYKLFVQHAKESRLVKIELLDFQMETDFLANIYCDLFIQSANGEIVRSSLKERWVTVDNQWYHVLYDPIFFNNI